MPKNRPNKRGRGKSANKNAPAAQKSKTTTGAATESAKGEGVAASLSEEQIIPSPASTEGGTPTGADKSVGQSAPPPSTTTSEEQIIQADLTGDQPSTGKQNGGGKLLTILFCLNRVGQRMAINLQLMINKLGESLLVLIQSRPWLSGSRNSSIF